MSAENQEFEALRKLLKLKRHEQPPPRYFNDFSTQVLHGIRQGRSSGEESEWREHLGGSLAWLDRWLGAFQRKPVYAGLFGAAICGMILVGIAASDQLPTAPTAGTLVGSSSPSSALPQPASVFRQDAAFLVSNTNPIVPSSGSLFDSIRVSTTPQPVNWRPSGN